MEEPFWNQLGQQLGITGAGLAIGGYILKRWLVNNMAEDAAKAGALKIKDDIIKSLREDRRESDAEWQRRWDRREKDFLEFKIKTKSEFETSRRITRGISNDLKQINAGRVPEERLETAMLITGLGPLDMNTDDNG